jgi:hypothetical protein
VVHRRRLLHVRPDYSLLLDEFRGGGEHQLEIFFHLAAAAHQPEITPDPDGHGLRAEARCGAARLLLAARGSTPLAAELVRGASAPPQGWVSRRYGEKSPAPVVILRLQAVLPAAVATLLRATPAAATESWRLAPLAARRAEDPAALAFMVESDRRRDLVLYSPSGAPLEAGGWRSQGELCWARLSGGRVRRLLAVATRRLSGPHGTLLDHAAPVTHYSAAPRERRGALTTRRPPDVRHRGSA